MRGLRIRAAACAATLAWTLAAVGAPTPLPPEVANALDRAGVPVDALVAVVEEVGGNARPRLSLQPDRPVNPASLMKLVTTFAGLELLGPAWRWTTPVWLDGRVADGILDGDLVVKGSGDPTLVLERLWLLLRRVRQAGVRQIRGDIVIDRSAFVLPPHDPAAFDGEPARPSNTGPDALLLNYRSLLLGFTPDIANRSARVTVDVPLAGVQVDSEVALASGPCSDWRAGLKADLAVPDRIRFAGTYPVACGVQSWPIAYAAPALYDARALAGLWRELGGTLVGRVRDGTAPIGTAPSFEIASPVLADVIRDINKFSNNLMAQQLFLTLAQARGGVGTPALAAATLRRWAADRLGPVADALDVDNGSGLSREGRLSARLLARLLQLGWQSPLMPEFMSSLPLGSTTPAGQAHLKTGTLRDVVGIAGYVQGASGRRYVVVAIINHSNAHAARAALDALVPWVASDQQN